MSSALPWCQQPWASLSSETGHASPQPRRTCPCQCAQSPSRLNLESRRSKKVPNLGLGPKWDQSAKMVPKKSRFCFQVPNFWFYLQMMLKRGGTYVAVRAQQWLFGHTQCMYHVHIFDTLWPSHIYWYILNWAKSRQRVFCFYCIFSSSFSWK